MSGNKQKNNFGFLFVRHDFLTLAKLILYLIVSVAIVILFLHNLTFIFLNQSLASTDSLDLLKRTRASLTSFRNITDVFYGRSNTRVSLALQILQNQENPFPIEARQVAFDSLDFLYWGNLATHTGNLQLANSLYRQAIMLPPENGQVWNAFSENSYHLDDIETALFAAQKAWQLEPLEYTREYVSILLDQSRDLEALSILEQILENDFQHRDRFWMFETLGRLYLDENRIDEGHQLYLDAIQEFPDRPTFYIRLGWLYYDFEADEQKAYDYFAMASATSSPASAYFAIGQLNGKVGNFAEAEKWFSQAIELEPNNRRWHVARGQMAIASGDFDLAVSIWLEMLSYFPNDTFAQLKLAESYIAIQSNADAREILNNIIAIEPNHEQANLLLEEIDSPLK